MPGARRHIDLIDPAAMLAHAEFPLVRDFLLLTRRGQIGWHYLTDLIWIYRQAQSWPAGARILDAGGGGGPVQYLLLEMGFDVTNIDLALPGLRTPQQRRYRAERRQLASYRPTPYNEHLASRTAPVRPSLRQRVLGSAPLRVLRNAAYGPAHDLWRRRAGIAPRQRPGRLEWIVGNLCAMPEIAGASFDAVVSLSALEHIPLPQFDAAIAELDRVLKPGARWAVTTSATERADSWFHEPSQGWCFTVPELARRFAAEAELVAPAGILEAYRKCDYLRRRLAGFYRRSGANGMPWGVWEPAYIPAGIRT